MITQHSRGDRESIYELLYSAEVPAPSATLGFEENVERVQRWNVHFAERLRKFLSGLAAAEKLQIDWHAVIALATERYRSRFLSLAKSVPDFMIWASLVEHAATRATVAAIQADVARTGEAVTDIWAAVAEIRAAVTELRPDYALALDAGRGSFGRVEALLALDAPAGDAMPALRAVMQRANAGVLVDSIVPAGSRGYEPHVTFPTVEEIYIDPRYRAAIAHESARPADDHWWDEERAARDDFDLMLAGYVTSLDATRLPMLLLGHPGAGKSVLTKVLAARLPASTYTVVRVPLRRVSANAPLIAQVQEALDLATNRRVEWSRLADQSTGTIRVVLLDGLDELLQASQQDRSSYLQEVIEFQRHEQGFVKVGVTVRER